MIDGFHIGLIIKVSKFCNLRCSYCYETPELGNPERISLENMERMFVHLRDFLEKWSRKGARHRLTFMWHGGEPFVQPLSYWEEIIDLEGKVFGPRFRKRSIVNEIQSNLTRLTPQHLPLIRRHFRLGFSYDVINDYRVDMGNRPTDEAVRKKIDWLLSEGIPLDGITVISKCNVDSPAEIADYFLSRELDFRALNVNEGTRIDQVRETSITYQAYIKFLEQLYRLPRVRKALETGLLIEPFFEARKMLALWRRGGEFSTSDEDCAEREWAIAVNTNGDLYPPGECYDNRFKYGNIFAQTIEEIIASEGRQRRIGQSRERLAKICRGCFLYRKGCLGTFVSHATPEEYRDFEQNRECHFSRLAKMMRDERNEAPE